MAGIGGYALVRQGIGRLPERDALSVPDSGELSLAKPGELSRTGNSRLSWPDQLARCTCLLK